jgi:hypothetical protein
MEVSSSIKNRLEIQYQTIEKIISSINSKRIELRPLEQNWNIHDIVAHLVRYQQVYIDRVQKTLEEEEPFFEEYKADNDSDFEYWCSTDMEHLLKQLALDRKVLIDMIMKLTPQQQSRIAMHKKFGSHKIMEWMEFFLLHEANHMYTIFKLAYDIEIK